MIKKILIITLLALLSTNSFAQQDEIEYELKPGEKEGWIIDKKGNKIEGIVRLTGTEEGPWHNQLSVRFIAKDDIDLSKKRQRLKTLDTDDLKGYAAYDNGALRQFELITYKNIRESSRSDGSGIAGKIKLIKNLAKSNYMAEVIVKGTITVYKLYGLPSSVGVGEKEIKEMEDDMKFILEHPTILVSKNGGKIEELDASDFKKLTEDCKYIRDKMLNREYSSYSPDREEKKRSKLGALLKSEAELSGIRIQKMATEILPDYNANCGK